MTFLGLDFGTSAIKALLVDGEQRVLATASAPLTVQRPAPGHAEQDPEAWWAAMLAAVDSLRQDHPAALAAVRGIGLSGQMHGTVLLDAAGQVLRPAMLWNDVRAQAECAALEAAWPALRATTGNIAMPGFTAPKLLWVRAHEPDVFARLRTVLLPKAYIRYRLTGELIEEMSDASGTLWLDVAARDWSDAALAATGLSRTHMPRLVEGNAPAGTLHPALAGRWGMAHPPILAGGAGDNAAGALGVSAIRPGDAFVSLGTSGVLFAVTDRARPYPQGAVHAFCHAIPDTWHQMGVTLSAAASLAWWSAVTGLPEAALLAELPTPAAPSPALFVPLSRRRAHPAQRRLPARGLHRPVARNRSARPDPGGAGRRRLLAAGLPGRLARLGHRGRTRQRHRRRVPLGGMAAHPGLRAGGPAGDAGSGGDRGGLRRHPAGPHGGDRREPGGGLHATTQRGGVPAHPLRWPPPTGHSCSATAPCTAPACWLAPWRAPDSRVARWRNVTLGRPAGWRYGP